MGRNGQPTQPLLLRQHYYYTHKQNPNNLIGHHGRRLGQAAHAAQLTSPAGQNNRAGNGRELGEAAQAAELPSVVAAKAAALLFTLHGAKAATLQVMRVQGRNGGRTR